MIFDESVDIAETIVPGFPGIFRIIEILGEKKATPERSVRRQSHLVQAGRAAIDRIFPFLPQFSPRDVPGFLIVRSEIIPDQRHLPFQTEDGR